MKKLLLSLCAFTALSLVANAKEEKWYRAEKLNPATATLADWEKATAEIKLASAAALVLTKFNYTSLPDAEFFALIDSDIFKTSAILMQNCLNIVSDFSNAGDLSLLSAASSCDNYEGVKALGKYTE